MDINIEECALEAGMQVCCNRAGQAIHARSAGVDGVSFDHLAGFTSQVRVRTSEAIARERRVIGWVCEVGAVGLPYGDPSRITALSIHDSEAKARAEADGSDFNCRVFPVYAY